MVIDGKPVRLVLQGDRIEAAKWIPYFAGLCRTMAHSHEKQTASREGMRGWAKNLGGQAFEIYVEVLGGLRYYDVSGYVIDPNAAQVQHHVDFLAWKIPDAKLAMAGDKWESGGQLRIGNSARIGQFRVMNGYYSEYNNSVVRIGGKLMTCYAGESADVFGVLLFQSKDVTRDQEDATELLALGDLSSNRHAIWVKDVLFLRDAVIGGVPKDFANSGQVEFLRMQHTATTDIDRGTILANWTATLIDHSAVNAAGGYLAALLMRRGRSVDLGGGVTQRVVYLSFWECYESLDAMYRWVFKMDVETGEFLATTRIAQPYSLDLDRRRIEGPIEIYLSWEGEFGEFFAFSVGTVTGVSEAMRVQTYDLWLLDRGTLAVMAVYFNCGIAQLGVYRDGCWAIDFRWADFEDYEEDPEHVRIMTIRGFMQQMARDDSEGVPVFTRVKELAEYPRQFILQGGNYSDRGQVEEGSGFIERYDD